ncbi:MAG: 4-hydroxy-tetrahydrodipicolinate reductase [Paludibacteraceae bacterium]|nr:4-hydroxy-tetrahydrodipicolinate reductase [Paludibacteraceae bacterium]
MKIALIGYGRMGHMIEQIALERGHRIVARIDRDNRYDMDSPAFADADVAIEFTTPQTARQNVVEAWKRGVSVVCGSTGWDAQGFIQEQTENGRLKNVGLIWSSNFSLGVNILFAMNRRLAQLLQPYPAYTPHITEVHHVHKLDAPSGTAVTLAEQIGEWRKANGESNVPIESIREGEVPGIHTVTWDSEIDTLTLSHSAKSRQGFALGAVVAAEWLKGKTGAHSMAEVLGIS